MRRPLDKLRQLRNPWIVLAVLGTAQFIDILDVTIVNVALPTSATTCASVQRAFSG